MRRPGRACAEKTLPLIVLLIGFTIEEKREKKAKRGKRGEQQVTLYMYSIFLPSTCCTQRSTPSILLLLLESLTPQHNSMAMTDSADSADMLLDGSQVAQDLPGPEGRRGGRNSLDFYQFLFRPVDVQLNTV